MKALATEALKNLLNGLASICSIWGETTQRVETEPAQDIEDAWREVGEAMWDAIGVVDKEINRKDQK